MKKKGLQSWLTSMLVIVVGAALLVVMPIGAKNAPAKPISLNVYYHGGVQGGQANMYRDWIQKVEKATDGRVKFTFYPGAVLGPPMEAYEMIKQGAVHMGCVIPGFFPGRFTLTNVVQLPFLGIPSAEIGSRIFWEVYQKFPAFKKDYPGVKVIALYTDAPTPIGTNKPVRKMEDLKGLKIRALSGAPTEMLKELGASPLLMPPTDIYTSMERGVIDGWMISWEGCAGMNYQEVTDYFTCARSYQPALVFLMNLNAWNKLPSDIQTIFDQYSGAAAAEHFGKGFDYWNSEGKKKVAQTKGKEIIELSEQEAARWKKTVRPVWDRWLADTKEKGLPGQAVLDEAERLLKEYTE
jgi:TRAP-type C4-dicarboxylate transport system substrate-binding protein